MATSQPYKLAQPVASVDNRRVQIVFREHELLAMEVALQDALARAQEAAPAEYDSVKRRYVWSLAGALAGIHALRRG